MENNKKNKNNMVIVGMILVVLALVALLLLPEHFGGIFNQMVNRAFSVFDSFIFGGAKVGAAIIVSVMIGRILERLGFTDALMRIFLPLMKKFNINPAVIIPAVYNILGDINAAGKIGGPILKKSGATRDEQMIAVCTMVQSQQSFSTFMLGIASMTLAGIKVFPIILIVLFIPLVVVPIILKLTLFRKTKAVNINELPSFTPNTNLMTTVFGAAREGAELLFLLIIPAAVVIFAFIGILEYIKIWQPIQNTISTMLLTLNIEPTTGLTSILISPTLGMANMLKMLTEGSQVAPRLVIGAFILASSGFPLSVVFGQIPAIWGQTSDLSEKDTMFASVLGIVMRITTAALVATFIPLW